MATRPTWLVVGADTLLGKEVLEVAAQQKLPVTIESSAAGLEERVIIAGEEEPAVMEPLSPGLLSGAAAVLLAGDLGSYKLAMGMIAENNESPAIVDLSGVGENTPNAYLRAPLLDSGKEFPPSSIWVVPHAAALILSRCLSLIHARLPIRHAVATVLEPASEQGNLGVSELQQQTISLFSFQNMPKEHYDAQVSFNLLPRFGDEAKANLGQSSDRLERHLTSLLAPLHVPLPSVRVLHAPVFHGYGIQLWVDFESRPDIAQLEAALAEAGLDLRNATVEPPSNLSVAGQSGISIGEIAADRNSANAAWLWLAADNLRIVAENALLIAGLATRK